jgi:hypothetical protein
MFVSGRLRRFDVPGIGLYETRVYNGKGRQRKDSDRSVRVHKLLDRLPRRNKPEFADLVDEKPNTL